MTQFQGHIPDRPPTTRKPAKTFAKNTPDFMSYIKTKEFVTNLDLARRFLVTTQTARIALVELWKEGKLERLPKDKVHDMDTYKVK